MTTNNFYTFPPSSKADWIDQVKTDLKGKNFETTLTSTLWEKIKIQPFYTAEDLEGPKQEFKFHPNTEIPGLSPRKWNNLVSVFPENEKKANEEILHALQNGADGLVLNLDGTENLNQIMKGVHTEFISTNLLPTGETVLLMRALQNWIDDISLKSTMLSGTILWSPCDELFKSRENFESAIDQAALAIQDYKEFRSFYPMTIDLSRYANAGATGIQELTYGLGEVIELIDKLSKKAISPTQVFENLAFHTAVGDSHFAEIAKVKALRKLIAELAGNYGVKIQMEDIHIITSTSTWSKSLLDKNTNLIRQTYEAMAGILGGSNSLWVKPAERKDASVLENRVARNVSSILKEESYLDKVMDPAAGSFYLEKLQEEIEKAVIKGLQDLEEKGGWLKSFEDRSLQAAVRNSRESAQKKILSGDTIKVGVNKYLAKDSLENHLEFEPIVEKDLELLPSRATYFVEQKTLSNA
ncbi:heterodimeric methylmalonyl-CoA mutase small subunit [Algoriphagus locisalis]|uniref:Heterodimeric methylmalonyl-CoA mutase small subunit n=1 Tax=Algoriphagus locisalis TaxID=305507 RepID=A0A1I7BVL3_9BACT|nr:methylmalonyl-CoA mutase family protein [Algoriphagus locisalis]SFT91189.1 heterodimeric methylmalonyl-CoA mutase small subunit [Algoriphagus locisalis]